MGQQLFSFAVWGVVAVYYNLRSVLCARGLVRGCVEETTSGIH